MSEEHRCTEECIEELEGEVEELLAVRNQLLQNVQQLEDAIQELRSSFEARMERAAGLVDEGELNEYWRGNRDALEVCLHKLAALTQDTEAEDE